MRINLRVRSVTGCSRSAILAEAGTLLVSPHSFGCVDLAHTETNGVVRYEDLEFDDALDVERMWESNSKRGLSLNQD